PGWRIGDYTPRSGELRILRSLSATGGNSIGTTTITIHQMLLPANVDVRSEHRLEGLQFRLAKALACRCHSADRAVILNQDILLPLSTPFAHVSFAIPDGCQTLHSLAQRRCTLHLVPVTRAECLVSSGDHFV